MISPAYRHTLLSKPHWNYHDVMDYFDVRTTKAYELMNEARKRGGGIAELGNCVQRDSLLAICGTNVHREISIIRKEEKNG